tara:strand:+ start:216 stop:602 length:387 start_codon:yes stop_codon:yes gene_type:complete
MRVAVAFVLAIVALMGGCASTGNQTLKTESEISVASKIVVGETSAAEIKSMFGSPFESSYTDGGLQIWKFRLDDMNADAVNFIPVVNLFGSSMSGKRKELVILFDDEDVVKRFNMSESDVQTKTGLFK